MVRFQILRLDAGAGGALGWVKGQCNRLIAAGVRNFSRTWVLGDVTVRARAFESVGDVIVKLFLVSAATNRLYNWPAATTLHNFVISALPTDPVKAAAIPASAMVMADPSGSLDAIDDVLAFAVDQQDPFRYRITKSTAAQIADFKVLAAGKKWLLRQWMAESVNLIQVDRMAGDAGELATPPTRPAPLTEVQFAALTDDQKADYVAGVIYWTVPLPINFDDCFMSEPDDTGNAQVLLGKFGDVQGDGLQHFRGVVLPTATLFALNVAGINGITADLSSFNPAITPDQRATIRVLGPGDYTRSPINTVIDTPDGFFHDFVFQYPASPFSVMYVDNHQDVLINEQSPTTTFPIHQRTQTTWSVKNHGVDGSGSISQTAYSLAPFGAAFTAASQTFGGGALAQFATTIISALENPVTVNLGDRLVQVGSLSYTGDNYLGGNGHATGTVTLRALTPFSSDVFPKVDQYVSEYSLVRSGGNVALATDALLSRTYSPFASVDGNYGGVIGPASSFLHDRVSISGDVQTVNDSGFMLSVSPVDPTFSPVGLSTSPVGSGLPILPDRTQDGGVFWYRDGPTGVFFFRVPLASRDARALDCAKYQNVFNELPGYRDELSDASGNIIRPREDGFEALDDILARIVPATTVIANNFASPALLPWIAAGLVGIIL